MLNLLTVIQETTKEVQLLQIDLNNEIKVASDKDSSPGLVEVAQTHVKRLQQEINYKLDYSSSLVGRAIEFSKRQATIGS